MKNIQIILIFSLLWFGCEKPIEPTITSPQNTSISIEVVETGIIDATLQLTIEDSTADYWTYALVRNDSVIITETVIDTSQVLFTDTNLLPTTEYNYQAYWMDDSVKIDSSNLVSVFTGDTTSHNFTWEIDTLGNYGSYLNDVQIVNENNIWVVGNIVTDSMEYNMAHWDGIEWELMGLVSQDEQIGHPGSDPIIENISSNTIDLYAIQYFSDDDMWVTSYGLPQHWDGENWTLYHLQNAGLDVSVGQAIWASSPDNIYFVGHRGSIVHYDSSEFIQMESGTDLDLTDIWGIDENNIWVAGTVDAENSSIILKKDGYGWNKIYEDLETSDLWLQSIYTDNTDILYLAGGHRSIYNLNFHTINFFSHPAEMGSFKVRGNNNHDIFYAGEYAEIIHFNGNNWSIYPELIGNLNRFHSLDVQENIVCAVGQIYYPSVGRTIGLIARGYR